MAMEVPVITSMPLPEPTPAEAIEVPGAATSGLVYPAEPCSPREVEALE